MIYTGTGDILASGADGLVNPVNCEGVMGKGLALQFKQRWPSMFEAYKLACRSHVVRPGHVHVWSTGARKGTRYIFNFPTKRRWRESSRLEDIELGLEDLARKVRDLGVTSLAVPALGAGLGGLDWSCVRPCIVRALHPLTEAMGACREASPVVHIQVWEPK